MSPSSRSGRTPNGSSDRISESESVDRIQQTNVRTYRDPHYDCDIPELSDVRARVQADDTVGMSLADALSKGFPAIGERFPILRTGERDPIPWDVRSAVHRRDGMRCVVCAGNWEYALLQLDHIVPWSAGGPDDSTNLRTVCEPCNTRRSNRNDGADGKRYLPVTWWCIDCHGPEWVWIHRPQQVRPEPPRIQPRSGLTFAYCATCDINSYTEVVL